MQSGCFVGAVRQQRREPIGQGFITNPDIVPEGAGFAIPKGDGRDRLVKWQDGPQSVPMIPMKVTLQGGDRSSTLNPLCPSRRLRAVKAMDQLD